MTTGIEWTDHTWSPWEGCTQVSPACDHCYAKAMNDRFRGGKNWGAGAPRRLTVDWDRPRRWNATANGIGRNMRVFPSICDPFDNGVPAGWRMRFFDLILATPHLDWLLLTKRIGNVMTMTHEAGAWNPEKPPPNVWIGATVCNQEEADRDVPKLLRAPARVRFLSVEPMLGPVTLPSLRCDRGSLPGPGGAGGVTCPDCQGHGDRGERGCLRLHWVICGGESGRGARPIQREWIDSLRAECAAAGVAFFFKQWGGPSATAGGCSLDGAEAKEWPCAPREAQRRR